MRLQITNESAVVACPIASQSMGKSGGPEVRECVMWSARWVTVWLIKWIFWLKLIRSIPNLLCCTSASSTASLLSFDEENSSPESGISDESVSDMLAPSCTGGIGCYRRLWRHRSFPPFSRNYLAPSLKGRFSSKLLIRFFYFVDEHYLMIP